MRRDGTREYLLGTRLRSDSPFYDALDVTREGFRPRKMALHYRETITMRERRYRSREYFNLNLFSALEDICSLVRQAVPSHEDQRKFYSLGIIL